MGEVLKHGTLSIGFIGLAETLKALYGHHHGESDAMPRKLGLADRLTTCASVWTKRSAKHRYELFTLLATPAEGSVRPFCTDGSRKVRA